jgi:hypothetical protein
MGFAPLEEIEGPIELTIRGRTFTLPQVSFEDGLHLQARIAEKGLIHPEIAKVLLGPVLDELTDAGVAPALISRVVAVAVAEWRYGREAAEKAWNDPKALVELIQVERQLIEAATRTPEPTAPTTPTPASRTSTSRTTPAKAPRSRGKKS